MNLTALKNKKASNLLAVVYVTDAAIKTGIYLNECLFSLTKQTHKADVLILHTGLNADSIKSLTAIVENPTITLNRTNEEGKLEQENIPSDEKINYVIEETTSDSFAKIFNDGFTAAVELGYELYTIIETEDVVNITWFEQAISYIAEKEDTSIFAPLTKQSVNGVFGGFMNEACWVEKMAEQPGYFDMALLTQYNAISPLGAIYKIEGVKELTQEKDGRYMPLKESMKLTNSYEFFLRMIYNDLKVTTIPRIGYEIRMINSKYVPTSSKAPQNLASLPADQGGMAELEIKFYLELAKKEYFFDEDRNKVYEQPVS